MPKILSNTTPLSLIGRNISSVLPDASARVVQTLPQQGGGVVTGYDTDSDGQANVRVSRDVAGDVVNVDVLEDNRSTLMWSSAGRIHWVQQDTPDGRFENVMDDDKDGLADRLARGVRGGTFDVVRLQQGRMPPDRSGRAVDLGVPASQLTMPHAALSPDHLTLTWHEDIEKADIDLFVPFSSLAGPTVDTAAIVGASPISSWQGTKQNVTVEADGIRLRIENTDGTAWMGSAPTLALKLADGTTQPLAVFAPKVLVDERAPELVGLRSSLDSGRTLRNLLRNELESVQAKLRQPELHLASYAEVTKLHKERGDVESTIEALRPTVRAAFVASPSGLDALAAHTGVAAESRQVFADAAGLAASGADGESVADYLDGRGLLDHALAFSSTDRAFVDAVERLFVIDTSDLPRAESDIVAERQRLMDGARTRETDLGRELAKVDADVVTWGRRLTALPGRAPEQRSTAHAPYTF